MVRAGANQAAAVTRDGRYRLMRSGPYRSVARSRILLRLAHTFGRNAGIHHCVSRGERVVV